MGETRVDLQHLLEDLRDAYPGSIEETILTEIMANALDSGATRITFECDPTQSTLITVDNGCGMQRRELARYHDIAASTKTRGQGIGFAGVGIKTRLAGLQRSFYRDPPREKPRCDFLAHGFAASGALEMGAAGRSCL